MYEYLYGKVTDIQSNYIVLEVGNIGYAIFTATPYSFDLEQMYKIYIYEYVREEEHLLYGFRLKEEKDLFLKLTSVKGLGCKMALPMIASNVESVMDAIERENILYLKKFPKIGDKVARQIILDLKGKLASSSSSLEDDFTNLTLALTSLGYKKQDIQKILPKMDKNLDIESQIKEALKLLFK